MSGDRADAGDTTEFIQEDLPTILGQYTDENLFNMDETAFYYKMLPYRTYAFNTEDVAGGKKYKHRLTLMLCCSANGMKRKAVVIGTAKKPRCLNYYNLSVAELPVEYYYSAKGWMTGHVLHLWLTRWNKQLILQRRKIGLLLDNASSHVDGEYSNIKLIFLPPNTTSILQPLDQGIIWSVKCKYRKKIAHMYLAAVEDRESVTEIMKSLDFKVTCDLIAQAWRECTATVIKNCFRKAGFERAAVPTEEEQLEAASEETSPDTPDENVWNQIQRRLHFSLTFDEFAEMDNEAQVHSELTDAEIVQQVQSVMNPEEETEEVDPDDDIATDQHAIITTNQFFCTIHQIRAYLQRNSIDTDSVDLLEKIVLENKVKKLKQKLINDYFIATPGEHHAENENEEMEVESRPPSPQPGCSSEPTHATVLGPATPVTSSTPASTSGASVSTSSSACTSSLLPSGALSRLKALTSSLVGHGGTDEGVIPLPAENE